MKVQFRIFLACGFGALIGSFLALSLASGFMWVGIVAGGLLGYIFYDPMEVLRTAQSTARFMVSEDVQEKGKRAVVALQIFFKALAGGINLMLIPVSLFWVINFAGDYFGLPEKRGILLFTALTVMIVAMVVSFFAFIITIVGMVSLPTMYLMGERGNRNPLPWQDELITSITASFILRVNFVTFYAYWSWYWAYKAAVGLIEGVKAIPYKLIGEFCRRVIVAIHTEKRLLCLFFAAVGSGAGWLVSYPIVGFFVGSVFGLITYEVASRVAERAVSEAQ